MVAGIDSYVKLYPLYRNNDAAKFDFVPSHLIFVKYRRHPICAVGHLQRKASTQ